MGRMGGRVKEGMNVYIQLIHMVVQQKLTLKSNYPLILKKKGNFITLKLPLNTDY